MALEKASHTSGWNFFSLGLSFAFAYVIVTGIYRLHFHPLAKIPWSVLGVFNHDSFVVAHEKPRSTPLATSSAREIW